MRRQFFSCSPFLTLTGPGSFMWMMATSPSRSTWIGDLEEEEKKSLAKTVSQRLQRAARIAVSERFESDSNRRRKGRGEEKKSKKKRKKRKNFFFLLCVFCKTLSPFEGHRAARDVSRKPHLILQFPNLRRKSQTFDSIRVSLIQDAENCNSHSQRYIWPFRTALGARWSCVSFSLFSVFRRPFASPQMCR